MTRETPYQQNPTGTYLYSEQRRETTFNENELRTTFFKTALPHVQQARRVFRVAHLADRAALFIKELQTPILDGEAWLSDAQTLKRMPREAPWQHKG
eukprot:4667621-Amphidinium_carterae.1